jgi:hypothetical protein
MLYVMSGRSDLARLAYSSALSRGHSLAAVSLLDLPIRGLELRRHADRQLKDAVNQEFHQRALEVRSIPTTRGFERFTTALRNEMSDASLTRLLQVAQTPEDGEDRTAAMQGILLTVRTMTALRGYIRVGHDADALKLIDEANDRACSQVRAIVEDGLVRNAPSLIKKIWATGGTELGAAKAEANRRPSTGSNSTREVVSSAVVERFGRAFVDLTAEERRVMVLRLAGLSAEEVAQTMGYESEAWGRSVFHRASDRLRREQLGEQFDMNLWKEVESCFDERELKAFFEQGQQVESESR